MKMSEIITRGVKSCPKFMGIHGAFYRNQFVGSRDEWKKEVNKLREESDIIFDEVYPHAHEGGNAGDIGELLFSRNHGYIYVYMMDYYGNWESRIFTHEVIAGKYTFKPPYGGYRD